MITYELWISMVEKPYYLGEESLNNAKKFKTNFTLFLSFVYYYY